MVSVDIATPLNNIAIGASGYIYLSNYGTVKYVCQSNGTFILQYAAGCNNLNYCGWVHHGACCSSQTCSNGVKYDSCAITQWSYDKYCQGAWNI
jgi:hypothetical protein